jgi:Kef-type K+ transport system membrane component KefB
MQVDLASFADATVLLFAGSLALAAVLGKLACAVAVPRPLDRLAVGWGMVPRGEVGFIFAGIGTTLYLHGRQIVPPTVFAAAVLVVILTTLAAPPLLAARIRRRASATPESP